MRRSASLSVGLAFILVAIGSETIAGQSAQPYSIQVSALGSLPFGEGLSSVTSGPGWEAQGRWNHSAVSIGVGIEQTFHDVDGIPGRTVNLTGGFVEPRYVIDTGSDSAVPYVSARVAVSSISVEQGGESISATGFTVNGGGGLLVRVGGRVNLDLGAPVGFKDLGQATIQSSLFDMGNGLNVIARAGLAVGVGRR